MDSPPPPYDETSSMLSSEATEVSALMTAAVRPPEYSACLDPSNHEVLQVEHIPSGSRAGHRGIPDPLDCNESSSFRAHPCITILPGSFNISTRATHPLFSCGVGPGCEDSDFRSSVSDTPPPPYEAALMTLRLHPVEIMSHDDTSCPDHVMPTVPLTQCAAPFINDLPMSNNHRPIPHSTSVAQPGRINLEDTTATQRQTGEPPCDPGLSFVCYVLLAAVIICLFVAAIKIIYFSDNNFNTEDSITGFVFLSLLMCFFSFIVKRLAYLWRTIIHQDY